MHAVQLYIWRGICNATFGCEKLLQHSYYYSRHRFLWPRFDCRWPRHGRRTVVHAPVTSSLSLRTARGGADRLDFLLFLSTGSLYARIAWLSRWVGGGRVVGSCEFPSKIFWDPPVAKVYSTIQLKYTAHIIFGKILSLISVVPASQKFALHS